MFARFCGFGPGHKSTHHVTKVFRDEIKEAFGLGPSQGKDSDDMGEVIEEIVHDDGLVDEKDFEDEADGDSDSEENGEDLDDLEYFESEEQLGYAPL